jgi:hypothetical protein
MYMQAVLSVAEAERLAQSLRPTRIQEARQNFIVAHSMLTDYSKMPLATS